MHSERSFSTKIFLLLTFLSVHSAAFLQNANIAFKNDSLDSGFLKKLFEGSLNNLRLENNLYHAEREDGMQLAADDHASYIKRYKSTGHDQSEKTKSTPQKRLAYFNSKCKDVQEICLFISVKKKVKKKSTAKKGKPAEEIVNKRYSEVISSIFSEAAKSNEESQKLLNANADSYGFAVEPDGDSALYVVILLARNPNITLKEKVPPSEFGVLPFEKKICECLSENETFLKGDDLTLFIIGDSLFIKSEQLSFLKKHFNGSKDAFYVDIVYRYQFPCNKKNLLHESQVYDGTMLKPVKWSELLARNMAKDGKNFFAFYSLIPPSSRGYLINYNTAYVKNGRACIYHYTFVPPAQDIALIPLRPKWIFDEKLVLKTDTFSGKIRIPFPFDVNETVLDPTQIKRLEKKLKAYIPFITKATIKTYSSIEGDEKSNLELQKKRAAVIHSFLKRLAKKEIPVEIYSKENWDYFLHEFKSYKIPGSDMISRDSIRSLVNDRQWRPFFKTVLNKSREATLELEVDARVNDQSDGDLIFSAFRRTVSLGDSLRANRYQSKLLQHYFKKNIGADEILDFNLPYNKKFLKVWTNYLALKVVTNEYTTALAATRDSMAKAAEVDATFAPLQFNLCLLALKHLTFYDTLMPIPQLEQKMRGSYSFAKNNADSIIVNHMFLNYNIVTLHLYWHTYQFDKINTPLNNIKKYYPLAAITEDEAIQIGLLFNHYTRWDWTQELLLPYMKKNTSNENTVFLFVQTAGSKPFCGEEEWLGYLRKAKKMNPARFKEWLDNNEFQLLRDERIKEVFCEK